MKTTWLPRSTPYDPSEDPPGSVDPLGTVSGAEQLAEVLLPGLTARMWRVRLLTFAALAAEVSKRVSAGREDRLVDARLAFERLFVSATARQEEIDPSWRNSSRRLPGIGLTRRLGHQPLDRANFLKGQVVNGPFGVIFRLARDVGIVDVGGELQRAGTELLLAWSQDQGLSGLLDEQPGRHGANWLKELVRKVSSYVDDGQSWPVKSWPGWANLADVLRLDNAGPNERRTLQQLLAQDPLGLRGRVIASIRDPKVLSIYRSAVERKVSVEREVIVAGFSNESAFDDVARTMQKTVELIDAYEELAGSLESVFRSLVWGLTRENGQASRTVVVQRLIVYQSLVAARFRLSPATVRFSQSLETFEADSLAAKRGTVDSARMHLLLEDAEAASRGVEACVTAVMDRHARVQKEKNKGVWIEDGKNWLLMPGFGDTAEAPAQYDGYLHPYRITNLYGMLADLKIVPQVRTADGEEKDE